MNNEANLTGTQFRTAATVLGLAALTDGGEVSEYAARTSGGYVHLGALAALVRKGVLVARRGEFTMPVGPYKGQTVTESFYSAA